MNHLIKAIFALLMFVSFTSCSLVIRKIIGLHDPVVETPETIAQFVKDCGCSYSHNYLLKSRSDSASILKSLFCCGEGKILLFDNAGNRYCYVNDDSVSCAGNLYKMAFATLDTNFAPCADDSVKLSCYLEKLDPFMGTHELSFTDSSYFLVYYWSKFLGGKRKYKDEVTWLTEMQLSSPYNITILAVNTDLQESWGLQAGKKLRMKLKVNYRGGSAEFGKIPYKTQIR